MGCEKMFNVIKPVNGIKRTVPKTADKSLDNNLQGRKPPQYTASDLRTPQDYVVTREQLQQAIDETNRMIFKEDSRFEFKMHERTGRILVKLVNNETDEVIKEIPPEKILDLVASIWDLVGILVDERG